MSFKIIKDIEYELSDLYRYIRPYTIPLEEETLISKLGCVIREYLYESIEFKVNCRIGIDDRLISCCSSLLLLDNNNSSLSTNKKKKHRDLPIEHYSNTDFYVAFNVRRAQSWEEPNAVLFRFDKYGKRSISNQDNKISQRGIQLDFLAKKQLKCMVMATYIKPKSSKSSSRKSKKRRQSAQPMNFKHQQHHQASSTDAVNPMYNTPKWGYGSSKSHNITASGNPHKARNKMRHNGHNGHNGTGGFYGGSTPTEIPSNLAIIYPQDNLLWSYYKNKAKIIEQNQWMPIVSLWRQSQPNVVYMLRGSNKKSLSNPSDITNKV